MRTAILFIAFLLLNVVRLQACDRCGCSLSGHYLSALPQYQRHVLGFRWYYREFQSQHHDGGQSLERFQSLELWGRFYPLKRLQVLAVLPLNYFDQKTGAGRMNRAGIGDAVLLTNYNLLQRAWGTDKQWRQALYLGGGVKLPTGRFDPALVAEDVNPNMQPGTGSTDALLSASYTLRYGAWGLSADALLRFNSANRADYRYGNRLNVGGRLFYWAQSGRNKWLPSIGLTHEWAAADRHMGAQLSDTGGYCLLGTAGLDWYLGHLAVSAQWNVPLSQWLGAGHVQAGQRAQFGLAYLF